MRILLIEDDDKLAFFLAKGLQENGFVVVKAADGEEGLSFALAEEYSIIVIDTLLPKMNGLVVIKKLRRVKKDTPILILSETRSIEERVQGLSIGSDDYLAKPFTFVEFLARINTLLRKYSNIRISRFQVGDIVLDRSSKKVTRNGKKINLNVKEFAILEYLMKHPGEIISRTMLMDHIWGFQIDPSTNIIDINLCHLKEKIDKGFSYPMIMTIRGVGYVLEVPE